MKGKQILACTLLVLVGVGLSNCGRQEAAQVPPAAETVSQKRNSALHTLVVDEDGAYFDFLLAGDDLYVLHANKVEQIPLAHPEERRQVLSFAEGSYGEFFSLGKQAYLDIGDQITMPSAPSARYYLQSQGQWVRLPEVQTYVLGDRLLVIDPSEESGNLYWLNGDEHEALGDKRYHYFSPLDNQKVAIWQDSLLIGGYRSGEEMHNKLLKVNLTNGETTVLSEGDGIIAAIDHEQRDIYQCSQPESTDTKSSVSVLTKISFASGTAEIIELPNPHAANYGQFAALEGQLYYRDNGFVSRPMIAGAVPDEYYKKVMDQWQESISGTYELFRWGEADSLNPKAVVKLLDRAEDYIYCLFEPENDRLEQRYPCLMIFDRTGQVVFETKEVVTKVSLQGDLLCFTVDERYDSESLGKVYWIWLDPEGESNA